MGSLFDEEKLLKRTPLQAITARTLDKISNRLDQKKYLLTDDEAHFRDWRGLLVFASLEHDDEQSIVSKKESFTTRIVILWSRRAGACVLHFVHALRDMDRLDLLQDYASCILEDCRSVGLSETPPSGIDQALTLQDLEALSQGRALTTYDAVVLFGDSDLDFKFGMHVVERLEEAGKKVFLYDRDLIIGAIEQEAAMRILRARCRKVIAILTPTFHNNKKSLFLTNYALHLQNDSEKNTRILPIIYSSVHLQSEVMKNIAMYSKLKYDRNNAYFWKKLFATLGDVNVHSDHLKLSFPMPHEFKDDGSPSPNEEKLNIAALPSSSSSSSRKEVPILKTSLALEVNCSSEESITSRTGLILPDTPSEEPSSPNKARKKCKHIRMPKWLNGRLSN